MTKYRRKGRTAIYPAFARMRLTRDYLDCYGADPVFRRALMAFYHEHEREVAVLPRKLWHNIETDPAHTDFVAAVKTFAERWKLHRLAAGCQAIGEWCRGRYTHPNDCTPELFRIGLRWSRQGWFSRPMPSVDVNISEIWNVESETEEQFRARIMRLVNAQIDAATTRIIAEAEAAGIVFLPVQATETPKHLHWLYRHVVKEHTYRDIAGDTGEHEDTIRHRIAECASRLELSPA